MARVGTISIDLVAHTGKLNAPLAKASTSVKSFVAGLHSTRAGFGSMLAGLGALTGGALSFYAAFTKVKSQFQAVDDISKSASRLGLTTEAFVGLQHGAELAGVETEALTKSLQKLLVQKTIKIAPEVAGLPESDQMVSVNVTDTAGALDMVADTMAGMASDAERLRYAIDIFGKDGAKMVDFLKGGSAGLRESQADAEKLGLTLSGIDAVKIEMANDAVSRLGAMITGVARKIAIELAPFIKAAADQFVVLGTEGEGVGGKVRAGVDLVVSGIGMVLDGIDLMRTGWAGLQLVAQMALTGVTIGIGFLVKGVELGTEAIINGFKFAWANATQIVQEAVAGMIALLSEVANWIESQLPERFQLGIGKAAAEFSGAFDSVVAENRRILEGQSFNVDLKFGDDAMSFANTLKEDTARAAKEFQAFAGREKMSDKLRRNVEQIREDAQKAAEDATKVPGSEETPTGVKAQIAPAALERGSQEAFSAFQANMKGQQNSDEKQLAEQKKMTDELRKLNKKGVVLGAANL